ncbi:cation diffusion facilitator family transporter [Thermodesulfobacteriota bacterium]
MVSFFIVKVGLDIFKSALREFADTAPEPEIITKIGQCATSVNGVIDTHDFRARTSGGAIIEIHIVVDGQLTVAAGHRIAKAVERRLREDVEDLDRVIVHVDPAAREKGDDMTDDK